MGRPCKSDVAPDEEYVGHMYNDWEIISTDIKYSSGGKAFFLCKCHCEACSVDGVTPTEKYVRHYYLYTGRSKRCRRGGSTIAHPKTASNHYDMSGDYGLGFIDDDDEPFLFDKEDYDLIKDYVWRRRDHGYIYTLIRNGKNVFTLNMHRLIMGVSLNRFSDDGIVVDHINHNTSDNRKENLRLANSFESSLNKARSSPQKGRGVYMDKNGKWIVQFRRNKHYYHGGSFDDYNKALKRRIEIEPDINSPFQYNSEIVEG